MVLKTISPGFGVSASLVLFSVFISLESEVYERLVIKLKIIFITESTVV